MSISSLLSESMSERAVSTDARQLERIVATASTHDERVRRVTEAYDAGRAPIAAYVAVVGMKKANVRPETSAEFVRLVHESIEAVPSKTVAAFEAYWRDRGRPKHDTDSIFEELYLEACACGGDEEEEEADEAEEEDEEEED
jgi:hypothetical protein